MNVTNCQLRPATATRSDVDANRNEGWSVTSKFFDQNEEARLNRQLDSILALEPNWDCAGAPAPDPHVVKFVKRFCNRWVTYPSPNASATVDGGVQLEWVIDDRTLEFEFLPHEAPSFICWKSGLGVVEEGELNMPLYDSTMADLQAVGEMTRRLILWVKGE